MAWYPRLESRNPGMEEDGRGQEQEECRSDGARTEGRLCASTKVNPPIFPDCPQDRSLLGSQHHTILFQCPWLLVAISFS